MEATLNPINPMVGYIVGLGCRVGGEMPGIKES